MDTSTYDNEVLRKIPFLGNFPFNNFSLSAGTVINTLIDETTKASVISFNCMHGIKASINLFEKEIWYLDSVSQRITKLNGISETINKALDSDSIICKRDAILECELWGKSFDPENSNGFDYLTFNEVLNGMVIANKIKDIPKLVGSIKKLHDKKSIIRLEEDHETVIHNFYQFQLIYFKMILGIVIASKISE